MHSNLVINFRRPELITIFYSTFNSFGRHGWVLRFGYEAVRAPSRGQATNRLRAQDGAPKTCAAAPW